MTRILRNKNNKFIFQITSYQKNITNSFIDAVLQLSIAQFTQWPSNYGTLRLAPMELLTLTKLAERILSKNVVHFSSDTIVLLKSFFHEFWIIGLMDDEILMSISRTMIHAFVSLCRIEIEFELIFHRSYRFRPS